MTGLTINEQYVIGQLLNQNGTIYQCVNLDNEGQKYILKLLPDVDGVNTEIKTIKDIKANEVLDKFNYPYDYLPQIVEQGPVITDKG